MFNNVFRNTLLTVGLLGATVAANAQTYATFGFTPIGTITANTNDVTTATSFTVPSAEVVNSLPATYMGHPNYFIGLINLSDAVTLSSTTVADGTGLDFSSDGFNFTHGDTVNLISNGAGATGFREFGTLTGPGITSPQTAEISGSFTQGSAGGTINGSFTLTIPPAVPEPGAVATLAGMGVAGVSLVARRRRK
jgi:hypothetical protein